MTQIRVLRKEKGMRAAEIFRPANMWPADLYRLERGEVKASPAVRSAIAAALGVAEAAIFDSCGWPLLAPEAP